MQIKSKKYAKVSAAVGLSALLALSGCASSPDSEGAGDGFEFGAPQEEVNEIIQNLEPVSLVYQPGASSQNGPEAATALAFKTAVEERSNGQITLDIAWGQAIAPYPEVEDALVDGRLDIAYAAPIYQPDEHPMVDAFSKVTQYSDASPLVGEAVSAAMSSEIGWNSAELLSEYTDKGITPLEPLMNSGDNYAACSEPGSSTADWAGRQVRVGMTAFATISDDLGATPVSMEYGELFEAIERGTVDCTFVQPQVAGATGITASAPYLSHFSDGRMTGSSVGANLAGSKFADLPLAYQQIVFDAGVDHFHGNVTSTMDGALKMVEDAKGAGGEVSAFDSSAEERISETQDQLVDDLIAEGRLDDDIREQQQASAEKWTEIVEELGYVDGGDLTDLDEWYESGEVDFRPLGERVFEETALEHRPS